MKTEPKMAKWPFIAGDIFLLGLAGWIILQSPGPLSGWAVFGAVVAVAVGAWLGVAPFVAEYRTAIKLAEADHLTDTMTEIAKMEDVAEAIAMASSQWQSVQEQSRETVSSVREISTRMAEEARGFREFLQKSNDAERNHLRLEVEKLRRAEGDWLQALVRLLDHVHALFQAGARSGQPNLREQLSNFQNACREIVRRLGLIAIEPRLEEKFDESRHQLAEGQPAAVPDAVVERVLATGYTFQGQLLRRALVSIRIGSATVSGEETEELDEAEGDLLDWRQAEATGEDDEEIAGETSGPEGAKSGK